MAMTEDAWQAAVDRAEAERDEARARHDALVVAITTGTHPVVKCARELAEGALSQRDEALRRLAKLEAELNDEISAGNE